MTKSQISKNVAIVIGQKEEMNAVKECQKLGIPIISLLDTNCDPDAVDIPIPANDDAIRSIKLILGKLADAIYEGRHGQLATDEDYEEFEDELSDDQEFVDADFSDEDIDDSDTSEIA
jgi:small subunit ribosomal protein S2